MGPNVGLNAVTKRKNSITFPIGNWTPVFQSVT